MCFSGLYFGGFGDLRGSKILRLGIEGARQRNKRFAATIMVAREVVYLGYYDSPEEASAANLEAAQIAFGEFACAG